MGEVSGVLAAILSSGLGGTSIGATRHLAHVLDPLAIGCFRFGIGFALLTPVALLQRSRWPSLADWPGVVGLGLLFFALFPILFNLSLVFTTAARGALALSALPLLTMLVAALLGREAMTRRKTVGVLVTMLGVALALLTNLKAAPAGAWRGDLLMTAAALCMALYSIWSKPLIRRSSPIPFTASAMGTGAAVLIGLAWTRHSFQPASELGLRQWMALAYLGAFGGALTFYLWAFALGRTTPTRVAISVTVNPIAAALTGAIWLHEPLHGTFVAGIAIVFAGIWIATSHPKAGRLGHPER